MGSRISHFARIAPSIGVVAPPAARRAVFGATMCSEHFHQGTPTPGQRRYSRAWLGGGGAGHVPGHRPRLLPVGRYIRTSWRRSPRSWRICSPADSGLAGGIGQALNEHISRRGVAPKSRAPGPVARGGGRDCERRPTGAARAGGCFSPARRRSQACFFMRPSATTPMKSAFGRLRRRPGRSAC